ncbi:MAG TPA: DUF4256 domain-containing protein [Pseudogracilibacillus sp.]|nr:DUF4256 domain-containing protein [Pseudogracilibacillus sp.]
MNEKKLTKNEKEVLLKILKIRFENNMHRHPNLSWSNIEKKINGADDKLFSLDQMEKTGGEPDIVNSTVTGMYIFNDCSKESPKGRRSICYDLEGLESRKKHQPENNAIDMAKEMGINLLTEEEYRRLQTIETFDLKTSSWIYTPNEIRALGGALFCDNRYQHVFTYHNGASSYYASRGFRASLKV